MVKRVQAHIGVLRTGISQAGEQVHKNWVWKSPETDFFTRLQATNRSSEG